MGQTLSHGVYLPNEGERNCYAGLASNWQILNTAVGAIAEKAPLVHTHTVSQITDFPAYGTTAGTICEGNDSRLSDARTPVAHTHGKADITNLFNSANTWSGENKYTSGFILSNISWSGVTPPSSAKPTVIEFKNSDTRQGRYINRISSTSSETWIETIRNVDANTSYNHTVVFQVDNSGNKSVYPYSNNDIDLGIATHQWNNLYANNYYYNGTAWGLDKQNEWTNFQRMICNPAVWYLRTNVVTLGTAPSANRYLGTFFEDVNGDSLGHISFQANKSGVNSIQFNIANSDGTNTYTTQMRLRLAQDGTSVFIPETDNTIKLGDSGNHWKDCYTYLINGINPGALSIFNPSVTQDPIDIPNTWVTDGSAWNTLNVSNMGDGWICLTYRLCGTNDYILARFGGTNANTYPSMIFPATRLAADSKYYLYVLMPVAKAMGNIYLEINLDSNAVLIKHSFIPAYGTV